MSISVRDLLLGQDNDWGNSISRDAPLDALGLNRRGGIPASIAHASRGFFVSPRLTSTCGSRLGMCDICGSPVEGFLEGVKLSICCRSCCTKKKTPLPANRLYNYCVSKNKATKELKCPGTKLEALNYVSVEQTARLGISSVMKLYVRTEVELAKKFHKGRLATERSKRKEEEKQMEKKRLERILGSSLDDMDAVLRASLCRGYFSALAPSPVKDIQSRFAVLDRVKEILETCKEAHPDAAFDFCLAYPNDGPAEFEELKRKMRSAFHLEGARIMHYVPKVERELLKQSPLRDVYQEFLDRDSLAIVRGHLKKLVGPSAAEEIMEMDACKMRLELGGEELKVAKKLAEFWEERHDTKKRKTRLQAKLTPLGLLIRSDCEICNKYLSGELDCDVEDVAAMIYIFQFLDDCGLCPHSGRAMNAFDIFLGCYHEMQMDFDTAMQCAEDAALNGTDLSEDYDDSDEDSVVYGDFLEHEDFFDDYEMLHDIYAGDLLYYL